MVCIASTSLYYSDFIVDFYERSVNGESLAVPPGEIVNKKVYIVGGWDDVTHIDEEAKSLQISNMSHNEIEARTQGIPARGGGKVYPILEENIICNPFSIEKENYNFVVGMDFGWTNYTALVLLAICKTTKNVFLIGEYAEKQLIPKDHVENLKKNMIFKDYIDWITILHDPAGKAGSITDGKSVASMYSDLGLDMINANNSVDLGVEKVRAMFFNGSLKIFKTCHRTLAEMRSYFYKDGTGAIKKGNDHLLDALRYAVMGLEYARSEKLSKIISFKF